MIKTPVLVYLRVSGYSQLDGDGFDRQLEACRRYAEANGYEIVRVYREEAVSGKSDFDERPELVKLFDDAEEQHIRVVMIEKLDRLARDLYIQETIVRDMKTKGMDLVSTMEPDLLRDDPTRVLIRQVFGAISQYERAMIVSKLRSARERIKSREGRCEGVRPFGIGKASATDSERAREQETVDTIMDLDKAGYTLSGIARRLNDLGIKTRFGGPWYASTVSKILRRQNNTPALRLIPCQDAEKIGV